MKTILSISIAVCVQINFCAQTVSTFAGNGGYGATNGSVTTATFRNPVGVAVASNGDVYVADNTNHRIRKISGGIVTTFAGNDVAGSNDGPAVSSTFNYPNDLAFDSNGNLIVADRENNKIRKIAPDGTVSTLAGTGAIGSADGNASTATFYQPYGIAIDANDNIFIADSANNKIRKISNTGVVSTFAGTGFSGLANGNGNVAAFSAPVKIAFDSAGNLYVTDYNNNKIRKITPAAVVSTFAGATQGFLDGPSTTAKFDQPVGICVDTSGNVYVSDAGNSKIRKITQAGMVSTIAGTTQGFLDGHASVAKFYRPYDIEFDNNGNFLIADNLNQRIRGMGTSSLSTANVLANSSVKIYPNPFTDEVNISIENSEKAELEILDMNGRLVSKKSLNEKKNVVNTSGLNSGIYLFKINNSGKISIIKGIKK